MCLYVNRAFAKIAFIYTSLNGFWFFPLSQMQLGISLLHIRWTE